MAEDEFGKSRAEVATAAGLHEGVVASSAHSCGEAMLGATDDRMLAAVDAWALARGWLTCNPNDIGVRRLAKYFKLWAVRVEDGGVRVERRNMPRSWEADAVWHLLPREAIIWALAVEEGSGSERCRQCGGRGQWAWWEQDLPYQWATWVDPPRSGACKTLARAPWEPGTDVTASSFEYSEDEMHWRSSVTGPCPDCGGQGRGGQELARRFLAIVRDTEQLSVFADDLQRRGHPLGIHVAHLLIETREGTLEAIERLVSLTRDCHPFDSTVEPATVIHREWENRDVH